MRFQFQIGSILSYKLASLKTALVLLLAVMLLGALLASCKDKGRSKKGGSASSDSEDASEATTLDDSDKIYLWLSSARSGGALGGAAGAHTVCQGEGNGEDSVLPNTDTVGYTHQAVIGDSLFNPGDIIEDGDERGVYRPDDSTQIANSYADFFDVLGVDALATVADGSNKFYWTGLESEMVSSSTCSNWTTSDGSIRGSIGSSGVVSFSRLGNSEVFCSSQLHLLCVSH